MCLSAEYMSGGNLFDYLQRNQEVLTLSQKLMLAINVAEGIKHLIGQMVIHQNINCSNILMDENNVSRKATLDTLFLYRIILIYVIVL